MSLHVINRRIFRKLPNMAEFKKAVQQYQELSKEWGKGRSRDNAKVRLLLA